MSDEIIYVKISNERVRELAVTTKLYETPEKMRYAVKYATYPEGAKHLQGIASAYEDGAKCFSNTKITVLPCEAYRDGLRFPYIEGETVEDQLNALFAEGKFEEAREIVADYLEIIRTAYSETEFALTSEFTHIFGKVSFDCTYRCGTRNNIDIVFDNLVVAEDATYLLDYEWTFDFPVPVEFILYRTLHYLIYRSTYREALLSHGFLSLVALTDKEHAIFDQMEEHFQAYVEGDVAPLRKRYGECADLQWNPISTFNEKAERRKVHVYYDRGSGYSEADTEDLLAREVGDFYEVNPPIPEDARAVRLDPQDGRYCYVRLLSVTDEKGRDLNSQVKSNGVRIKGIYYFLDTIDPWFSIPVESSQVTIRYQLTFVSSDDMRDFAEELARVEKYRRNILRRGKKKAKRMLYVGKHMARHVKHHGIRGIRTAYRNIDKITYHQWFLAHRVTSQQLEQQRIDQEAFLYRPLVSILVPAYRTPERVLREMIDSVIAQSYLNWELCIADGSMEEHEVEQIVTSYAASDSRIRYQRLAENGGISANTNAALAMASGDYVGLLDHDDLLEPDTLYEIVRCLQSKSYDVLYTDEDKMDDVTAEYIDPNLKPDFSIDLFRSHNYITHFFVAKRSLMNEVGGFRSAYDGSQDYDMMFRCGEKANGIYHVPKILYHWRMITGSTAENPESKMYCYEAGRKAVESHLERVGLAGKVEMTDMWGIYHTTYRVNGNPLVSIVIANKDLTDMLDRCIRSIEEKSTYRNFEIIIVENNSIEDATFSYYEKIQEEFDNVRVITWTEGFNYSSINNYGVQHAKGDYILLLNNDTEMITPTAIEEMLGICTRDDVGIVGAKLLYEDDTVQHAGVVVGFGGYAAHVFHGIPRHDLGYMMRPMMNCNYSAVTAACLMVKRRIFDEVGGLTEEFRVACNDIDFCLKVRKRGYLVVYNAFSEWYHYESKSRGYEDTPEKQERFMGEVRKFQERWSDVLAEGDPYYNPNFPYVGEGPFQL